MQDGVLSPPKYSIIGIPPMKNSKWNTRSLGGKVASVGRKTVRGVTRILYSAVGGTVKTGVEIVQGSIYIAKGDYFKGIKHITRAPFTVIKSVGTGVHDSIFVYGRRKQSQKALDKVFAAGDLSLVTDVDALKALNLPLNAPSDSIEESIKNARSHSQFLENSNNLMCQMDGCASRSKLEQIEKILYHSELPDYSNATRSSLELIETILHHLPDYSTFPRQIQNR
ncbi:hypothetical protein BC833DRAFT_604383 [Globomyces pollinis-pini]|nr:hypothetical protein BC833DRAFT_604383 [Globomyces pollinis-pini]